VSRPLAFASLIAGACINAAGPTPAESPAPYPPLATDCSPARIGKVTVIGASLADVAPLAVLEGTLDDPDRATRIAAVATELLQARGYPDAKLDLDRSVACGTDLTVTVHTGPRYRIAALLFDTDDAFPAGERALAVEDALGTVNVVGGAYLPDRMTRALSALEHRYHEAGWIDAVVGSPQAHYDTLRNEITVRVSISAGPRYRIGRIVTSGGSRMDRAAVIDALGLRGGDWYNGPRVRIGVNRARHSTDHHVELIYNAAHGVVDLEARLK
jgi:outer membrane translocation and assembly module TamA